MRSSARRMSWRHASLVLVLGCFTSAHAAQAQDRPVEEAIEPAQDLATAQLDHTKPKPDLLVVPIPISNPALGTGLTLAGMLIYNPNEAPQPWVSGIGATYTETGTWGVGGFHSMSLEKDKYRLMLFGGYSDAKLKFYGVGADAGERDVSVDIDDKGIFILGQAQVRIAKHLYAGARYEYLNVDSRIDIPHPNFPDLNLPAIELDSKISMVGPMATFDSRDSSLNPRRGAFITVDWLFGADFLGSDFTHDKLQVGANLYKPIGKNTVVGVRKSLCAASEGAPFYDLCMFGQMGDLRGFESGRYRDRVTWAFQGEFRQHLFGRFGAVAFGGIGGVAPRLKEIGKGELLGSFGAGLRYRASRQNNINLRLDLAFTGDDTAVYFGIGESF